jgi:putative RNA 2'-phosphotransferase
MEADLMTRVSKHMSYFLRHCPQNLKMDAEGFVNVDELLAKIRALLSTRQMSLVDKNLILEIVDGRNGKRFEVKEDRIRALYGHTIPVKVEFEEDTIVKLLYHGTTSDAASKILKEGVKPMKRKWVHLSPTVEVAKEIGLRRTKNPVILKIDAEAARKGGTRFYRATDKVYLCGSIPPKYVRITGRRSQQNGLVEVG